VDRTRSSLACRPSRRDAILDAAEAIFAEHGYDRARLEDIARAVGIRRASLLYHFRDKAALYAAVLDSLLGDLEKCHRRVLETDAAAGARLESSIDVWIDFTIARPALVRIMLRELADGVREGSRAFAERAIPIVDGLTEVILAGQAEHALRRTSALHVLMILAGASAFLTLGGAVYSRDGNERFPVMVDRVQHRELMLAIIRKLLGTAGPRAVVDGSNS
jgi:TetR/AcrR family transcriptional regulator